MKVECRNCGAILYLSEEILGEMEQEGWSGDLDGTEFFCPSYNDETGVCEYPGKPGDNRDIPWWEE